MRYEYGINKGKLEMLREELEEEVAKLQKISQVQVAHFDLNVLLETMTGINTSYYRSLIIYIRNTDSVVVVEGSFTYIQ